MTQPSSLASVTLYEMKAQSFSAHFRKPASRVLIFSTEVTHLIQETFERAQISFLANTELNVLQVGNCQQIHVCFKCFQEIDLFCISARPHLEDNVFETVSGSNFSGVEFSSL